MPLGQSLLAVQVGAGVVPDGMAVISASDRGKHERAPVGETKQPSPAVVQSASEQQVLPHTRLGAVAASANAAESTHSPEAQSASTVQPSPFLRRGMSRHVLVVLSQN